MFIKNIWYVCSWGYEVTQETPVGRIVAEHPVVLWRDTSGQVQALEDRCPHRHAPLSKGRIEGDELRCMYHGLKVSKSGQCTHIPATDVRPPNCDARAFPVVEQDGWVWIWPGDPELADPELIPKAWGLDDKSMVMKTGALDYAADYQLINDNLTDLSHIDYVHEQTLMPASGAPWSGDFPEVKKIENGLRIQRWLAAAPIVPGSDELFESFNTYDYMLPGVFLMKTSVYPAGTAEASDYGPPSGEPIANRVEQQAVTPTKKGCSRYLFASGAPSAEDGKGYGDSEKFFEVVMAAFAEDKEIIEAQQVIWDLTPEDTPKAFIPQDKAPAMLRRMITQRLREEAKSTASA